jgi:predicted ferric reductase
VNRTIVGVFWLALYLVVILLPLVIMMVRPTPAPRPFLVEFSLALGFVGLVQISVQLMLIARYPQLTGPYGIDLILKYHRQIATVAILLIVAHPIILVIDNPTLVGLLNPFGGTTASRVGNVAIYALVLLAALSIFRQRMKLDYELWRVSHALLGVAAIGLSHWHIRLAGHYTDTPWKERTLLAISLVAVAALVYLRIVKPALLARRPYRVSAVTPERGSTWSFTVTADGHDGLRFEPGQFAWLKVGASPWTIEEHPFSFSSSALERGRLEFGIKELGDFTSAIGKVPIGTRVYVDGPHGAFSPDREAAPGYVFFAGGIGISPFMSMLRTMADRADSRPITLFYGAPSWDETAYRDDLEALSHRLELEVVYVLEEAPEGWQGETGFIDAALLARRLPDDQLERLHFVCGPPAMIDAVERALSKRRVPLEQIRSERFELV